MPSQSRSYPRATLKKIVKGHANRNIGKGVDHLIYLDYAIFVQELMAHAARKARASGEKKLAARDIRKVTMATLRKFRG